MKLVGGPADGFDTQVVVNGDLCSFPTAGTLRIYWHDGRIRSESICFSRYRRCGNEWHYDPEKEEPHGVLLFERADSLNAYHADVWIVDGYGTRVSLTQAEYDTLKTKLAECEGQNS